MSLYDMAMRGHGLTFDERARYLELALMPWERRYVRKMLHDAGFTEYAHPVYSSRVPI